MLPSRGFVRSASILGAARTTFPSAPTRLTCQLPRLTVRQFATTLRVNNAILNGASTGAFGNRGISRTVLLPSAAALNSILSSISQVRHASTQPPQPPPAPSGAEQNITDPASLTDFSSAVDLTGNDLLNMPEQIGYLKALGLDFGWFGPTPLTQWVLEHTYVLTGMPWWASIGVVALLTRGVLFYGMLRAAENTHRMAELKKEPAYDAASQRVKEAMFISKDTHAMMTAQRELQMMHKIAGVNMWWGGFPMLQAVFAYGMIRLMRAMAAIPVPSLETGGALWFTDLSVADPYYILPVASAVLMYSAMRMGIPYMDIQHQRTLRTMGVVLMPVGLVITLWLPSGVQLYFVFTSALQYLQQYLTYNPSFRRWMGLKPIQPSEAPAATQPTSGVSYQAPRTTTARATVEPTPKESIITTMKAAWNDNVGELLKANQAKQEMKHTGRTARDYQEKRALEDREDFEARLEKKRAKGLFREE